MTPKEAVATLVSAFGNEDISQDRVKLYVSKMQDINPKLLAVTIAQIIDKSRFFPTIAEIRETAAGIAGVLPMTPEEAVAIVRKADREEAVCARNGEYRYTERFWDWPEDVEPQTVQTICHALERTGDPVDRRDNRIFGWETEFKRVYGVVAEAAKKTALADLSRAQLPGPRQALPKPRKMLEEPEEPIDEEGLERAREMIRKISDEVKL